MIQEKTYKPVSGWLPLLFCIALLIAGPWLFITSIVRLNTMPGAPFLPMLIGGIMVTVLGLKSLDVGAGSIIDGFGAMIEANQAKTGVWKEAVHQTAQNIVKRDAYNRMTVIQPALRGTVLMANP